VLRFRLWFAQPETVTPAPISRRRDPQLVRARTEVARRAIASGVATLSVVATRFGRAASSLSEQLCRRFKEHRFAPPD